MKVVNFRPFLLIFILTAVGIFAMSLVYTLPAIGIFLLVVAVLGTALTAAISHRNGKGLLAITCIISLIVMTYTCIAFNVTYFTRFTLEKGTTYTISARVTEKFSYESGIFTATLDSVQANGENVSGKMSFKLEEAPELYEFVTCGYIITFTSEVSYYDLITAESIDASGVRSDVRYYVYPEEEDIIIITPDDPSFLEGLRYSLKTHLIENMGEDAGTVAYGMIAGDKYTLDDEINDAFSGAGIGHILAVSGLHIGLISALVYRLLQLLPIPNIAISASSSVILLLYAIFTGGSPSSVRAFVMCSIAIWAYFFGRADALNSLAAGATVCLCISPYFLFECGYILSISAVFGLVTLGRPLANFIGKVLPMKMAQAISSSFTAQLAITPAMAMYFTRGYTYSFFVNAVMMGLLSLFFSGLALIIPISLIPGCGFLLIPFGLIINAIVGICTLIASLPLAVYVWQVSPLIMCILPFFFIMSSYVNLPRKRLCNCICIALCVGIAIVAYDGYERDGSLIAAGGECAVTVLHIDSEAIVFGDFENPTSIIYGLDAAKLGGGEITVYCENLTSEAALGIMEVNELRPVKEVRFALKGETAGAELLIASGIEVTAIEYSDDLFTVAYYHESPAGWLYSSGEKLVYITTGDAAPDVADYCDIVRSKTAYSYSLSPELYITARDYAYKSNVRVASRQYKIIEL